MKTLIVRAEEQPDGAVLLTVRTLRGEPGTAAEAALADEATKLLRCEGAWLARRIGAVGGALDVTAALRPSN